MRRIILFLMVCLGVVSVQAGSDRCRIDLSGIWRFQLDPMGFGKTPGSQLYLRKLSETITLPGSTDEAGKGVQNNAAYIDRLSRRFEYQGPAWYQREILIPADWAGKEITLFLERCHWETTVYIDGKQVGVDERLSTPNRFTLPETITPGVHTLTCCVDNRLKYPMDQWNHGTTEYTQTNWNGITGRIELQVRQRNHIRKLRVFPSLREEKVRVTVELQKKSRAGSGLLSLRLSEKGGEVIRTASLPIDFAAADSVVETDLVLGKEMKVWDEFTPFLYDLDVRLTDGEREESSKRVTFGMRQVEQGTHQILLNGRKIHLRGALDCAVFPLTGYPSAKREDWARIFQTVKAYGMNHVRFHSWCPPEAAFDAADELGLYLQVELPMWIKDVGKYLARRDFFEQEMYAILDEYGNHPSFLLFCNGNENEGNFDVLEDLIKKGQAHDPRHLYSASTARTHVKADQFYTSHVTSKKQGNSPSWITVYEGKPSTDWDRSVESDIDVPVIAHETGQRCMYPNFEEIRKYTGVLEARNLETFKERLTKNGMLHQANDFFRATGAHTVLQYKEVNEALLRTATSGGFQLLGLSDFPGQGSAYVGILDAFWESKGLVSPEKYRESCAPTVLLARFPKRTYADKETLQVKLEIYHYGQKPIRNRWLEWSLESQAGDVVKQGRIKVPLVPCGTVDSLGRIEVALHSVQVAGKYTLKTQIAGETRNEWDFWIYPSVAMPEEAERFVQVNAWDEQTKSLLEAGQNVLLIPDSCPGRKTKFASHFWNPIMFKWAPLIVGTWIDAAHPAFRDFPTAEYADWQWWDILQHARAMDLTALPRLTPLIQSIDSYETNRKLGISFEASVGKGKLFVLCVDREKEASQRLATRQLLYSVKRYISSEAFVPRVSLKAYELDALFDGRYQEEVAKSSDGVIKQLLNQ